MENLSIPQFLKKSFLDSTLADKITFLTFLGTAITCLYSAIMFLPGLENRVIEIENQIKILPQEIDKLHLNASHLEEVAKNSEKMNTELENVKKDNNYLKGKIEVLEKTNN